MKSFSHVFSHVDEDERSGHSNKTQAQSQLKQHFVYRANRQDRGQHHSPSDRSNLTAHLQRAAEYEAEGESGADNRPMSQQNGEVTEKRREGSALKQSRTATGWESILCGACVECDTTEYKKIK